ncbi:hypothetical protein ACTWP5_02270 [Streptomyces sp. 4N509B]|uniref:hypothetical protein n=1 Tax=Streptomyces sp. 4N509B TaxID=3457413 RepID=UPI003FD5E0A6
MSWALVFVYSNDVGPYINVLSYLEDKRSVSNFKFVFLTGVVNESPRTNFVDSILLELDNLANGTYKGRELALSHDVREKYASIARHLRRNDSLAVPITMEQLGDFLKKYEAESKPIPLLVDVTGLPKTQMAHVLLVCLSHRSTVTNTFELLARPNRARPELSLYHALGQNDFWYASLTRDLTVHNSVRQLVPVRRVVLVAGVVAAITLVGFFINLLTDPESIWLSVLGITSSLFGILSTALQFMPARRSR